MSIKNSRAKGSRLVRQCRDWWESFGYRTGITELGGRFTKEKDLFGVADFIAIRKDKGKTYVAFIQVTSERPHTLGKYKQFAKDYVCSNVLLYQFVWKKRKGWKVYLFNKDGTYTRSDITMKDIRKRLKE